MNLSKFFLHTYQMQQHRDNWLSGVTDGLGSVRGLSDGSGNSAATYSYDAFGMPELTTGSADNDFLYRAEQQDPETGLIFLRARYYDPSTGRFLTRDSFPADKYQTQDINRYVYTGNNPVNRIDPSGRLFGYDDLVALGVGGVGGYAGQALSDKMTGTSSNWRVYDFAISGGALTSMASLDAGEIATAATLPVAGSQAPVYGIEAGYETAVAGDTLTNRAIDWAAGKPLDWNKEYDNAVVQAATDRIVEGAFPIPEGMSPKSWQYLTYSMGRSGLSPFLDEFTKSTASNNNQNCGK